VRRRAMMASVPAVLLCLLLLAAPTSRAVNGMEPGQEAQALPVEGVLLTEAAAPAAPSSAGSAAKAASPSRPSPSAYPARAAEKQFVELSEEGAANAEEPAGGLPTAAAVPPPTPQDFTISYNTSDGKVTARWSPVSAPDLKNYVVHRWTEYDYGDFLGILLALRQFDPSATGYLQSLQLKVDKLLNSPGLTFTERQAMLDDIETDLDALLAILCSNLDAQPLLSQAKNLADRYTVRGTTWSGSTSSNSYYWYAVLARNRSGQESPFSHCEVIFSARDDGRSPAAPKGFSAVGYDPGVDLSWSRNTETDLAGYNLYRQQSGSWVKLNSSLVTVGTEFFFDAGASGESYAVTAVDVGGRESARTTATATLAPTVVYQVDDPGWSLDGTWKIEHYDVGGEVKRILVANDAGSRASLPFTGRMVKLLSSTYHTCGKMRVYIDGRAMGVIDLNSPSVQWEVNAFTATGLSPGNHLLTLEATGEGGQGEFHFINVELVETR